jgi:hypothetical protein
MRTRFLALLLAGGLAGAASTAAHHSLVGIYREHERVTIEGELVTLVYRNPHSYLHVMAPDRDRHNRLWAVESVSGQLLRQTLSAAGLTPGDRVIVTGAPGRDDGVWRIRLRTIVRPSDGWRWTEGPRSRPRPGDGLRSRP